MLCNIVMNNLTISLVVLHKTRDPKKFNKFPFSLRVETFYNEILCCTAFLSFHKNLFSKDYS